MSALRPTDVLALPEEATPPGLQRLWTRRLTTGQIFEEESFDDLFLPAQELDEPTKSRACTPNPVEHVDYSDWDSDAEKGTSYDSEEDVDLRPLMCLDGASLGDIPARYVLPSLSNYEFPVIGVFVDPRVVPGFRYKVRVLPDSDRPYRKSYLFNGKGLTLESIGRGYSRRLTFEADSTTTLNENDNYFWADSRSEGFGFEVQVISEGDKFTAKDPGLVAAAEVEVVTIQGAQEEVSHVVLKDGSIEKRVRVKAMCRVEWFDEVGQTLLLPVSGIAVCVKKKGDIKAAVQRVQSVTIGSHQHRRGFTLLPGTRVQWRRRNVNGAAIGDIPAQYTIVGLEPHELPVIGTYVDPRIVPGFKYKVRPSTSKRRFFNGEALRLTSVGMGYGKRISFQNQSKEEPPHFWSDSSPDGFGFETIAVETGMKFQIENEGLLIGHADIFRADRPQCEVRHTVEKFEGGSRVFKYVDIDVTCHVSLTSHKSETVMRVTGTAVVCRNGSGAAKLERIENIGLDSQINLLFIREHGHLVLVPTP